MPSIIVQIVGIFIAKCIKINSWKNFCCSRECYRQMIAKQRETSPIIVQGSENMQTILRAGLKTGLTISITGYDLELGRFDCSDGTTRSFDDFEYFILPVNELKDISTRLAEKIETSKKNRKNVITETESVTE